MRHSGGGANRKWNGCYYLRAVRGMDCEGRMDESEIWRQWIDNLKNTAAIARMLRKKGQPVKEHEIDRVIARRIEARYKAKRGEEYYG